MKAYKGFNKDMTCRGFQYEEGKEYETERAELCNEGFHACENPLDCFNYYVPGESVYREVELDDVSDERGDDSKVVGKKIKIGAALSVAKICQLHFEYVKERTTNEHTDEEKASAGDSGSASAGDSGSASAGYRGSASAGDCGSASAGASGSASAGDSGSASAGASGSASAGYRGSASAGDCGSAVSGGKSSVGENGIALCRGNNCMIKGGVGSILVIAEEETDTCDIKEWKSAIVDGEKIKADTWYKLENGEFVEVNENE